MNGEQLVANMKRLSQVESVKDISQLTHAVFPGTHCPLMGAMMAVRGISDSVMLVIGTDECTYYTKSTTISNSAFGGMDGRCLSVVLSQHEVTFGCREKLERGFAEMMAEYRPKAVFLVTTCIIELIGDDIDSIAMNLAERYGVAVLPVHTEHFKTENHLPGVRDTITACFDLVEPREPDGRVNVIGQRMGDFTATELYRILREADVPVGMMLPSGCTVEEVKDAATARANVVVHPIGLPLAQKMEKRFGTPYVFFDKYIHPDRIQKAYADLFRYLGKPLPAELGDLFHKAWQAVESGKAQLRGLSYIYGNTPLHTFEFCAFMTELGMRPLLLQTAELPPAGDAHLQYILARHDPYVTKTANIAPLQYVYDVLRPNLYLGHEFAARLREKGIELVRSDLVSDSLGFEVTLIMMEELQRAGQEARELTARRRAG